MPVWEEAEVDLRGEAVRALIEWVKDEPATQQPYRLAEEQRQAKAARRERMRAIARLPRRSVQPRPWQSAGVTKQEWIDAGNKVPLTRREKIEARVHHRKR